MIKACNELPANVGLHSQCLFWQFLIKFVFSLSKCKREPFFSVSPPTVPSTPSRQMTETRVKSQDEPIVVFLGPVWGMSLNSNS